MLGRIIGSLLAIGIYETAMIFSTPAVTLTMGHAAGGQFANSDAAYTGTVITMNLVGNLARLPAILLLVVLLLIWWGPIRQRLAGRTMAVALCLILGTASAHAYYDKTDYTEAYTILPNESAFWIPDAGANKDGQAQFESEAYLNANKIPLKRFIVPHVKLSGSGGFYDYYVPAGRLIIVDRTPYSCEWVDALDRGTSRKKEGFPCQTNEGLNITVGISVGASVPEANAAKYLYRFGVLPITGDRTNPSVIFNSVYYSRRLADVMDDVGRKKVQTLVCAEITARTFDKANADANQIIENVRKSAMEYFASVGISLDFIGWADTFTFDKEVQDAVNRRYIAAQDKEIATALAPHADTIQKLAAAHALRAFGDHSDGKLPTTIVGLPPDIGGLLGSLLKAAPPPPVH
jgi:hypothetical protein